MSGGGDIQPLSLDVSATRLDTARRLRNEYGVNSPKGADRGRGTGTPVGPEARREAQSREKYGVNSPRANHKKKNQVPASSGGGGGLQALVTQVPRTDPDQNKSAPATSSPPPSFVTQVDRPDPSNNERDNVKQLEPMEVEQREPPPQQPQSTSCWSCLFSCCMPSTPPSPAQNQSTPTSSNNQHTASPKVHPAATKPVQQNEYDNREAGQTKASAEVVTPAKPGQADTQKNINHAEAEMPSVEQVDAKDIPDENSYSGPDPEGYLGPNKSGKKRCLVLDLDETLVHSSFKPVAGADFIVPVTIDGVVHKVYVGKRPYADEFLIECAKHWEVVIFTASLSKYADPLLDMLDKTSVIRGRLFREHCVLHGGNYVKDLTKLGRKLKNLVIIDNAPKSYLFQPNNAVNCTSWFDDKNDTELLDCIPVLTTTLLECEDVRDVLDANNKSFRWLCRQARQ